MAKKAERGTKRVCAACDGKFYDLNKKPATCPLCGTVYEPDVVVAKPPAQDKKPEKPAEETAKPEADEDEETETVSLDEVAESEEAGEDININDEDVLVDIDDDDADIPGGDDDDTFLEEDDEGSDDVTGIVGGAISEDGDDS